ncbi:hypothetical protein A3F55_00070 [Candidatus Adlerbacteria bacterium RIFCSPHIGHO2_12_FULL_53_18]|uniref:Uncharacterized protein n=1 Tax=Candidatus Adlerbacteria bacterium RIFCSPHIGHO2_12_FULL_53_18 TaxID=1797242 RepID=A0A1F4XTK8_9BACT|nr:MAG: hypothetical protein A3F55_00070 [Candidatus Adlerbacteria bacterium RIFCSPHIGHO2_12_FULL_53_18]
MNNKTYYTLVSVIFFTIAFGHALRLLNEWEAVIAGVVIPLWASLAAVAIAGYLGVRGWQLANKHR